jgi:hypothetical protein
MADTPHPTLADRLATTATGWGAVIDGVLNIRTVSDTVNAAALNALFVGGYRILSTCADTDCDCMVQVLGRLMPQVRLVRVKVEVENG